MRKRIYIGIAYDEQQRCLQDGCIRYPLVEWKWTEQDCVDYLSSKGLLNPLYQKFNRLGCYFCQKQSLPSLYQLWKHYPDLWKQARWWDEESRRITEHGTRDKPLIEYQRRFESGYVPPNAPKYACQSCDAVGSVVRTPNKKQQRPVDTSGIGQVKLRQIPNGETSVVDGTPHQR